MQALYGKVSVVLAGVIVSCLVTMMAVFMGGGQPGEDLRALLLLQAAAVPAAILVLVLVLNSEQSILRLYAAIPQWMLFACFLLNLLAAAGEVAFLVVARTTESVVPWYAHVPLICMISCSLALCALYAKLNLARGRGQAMSGRWP